MMMMGWEGEGEVKKDGKDGESEFSRRQDYLRHQQTDEKSSSAMVDTPGFVQVAIVIF